MIESLAFPERKGVVLPRPDGRWKLRREEPIEPLEPWVSWVWTVVWDVPEPIETVILPYPSANLVYEAGEVFLHGPLRGVFTRRLVGRGTAVGVRFRPGALRQFVAKSVNEFLNIRVPAQDLWPPIGLPSNEVAPEVMANRLQQHLAELVVEPVSDRVALAMRAVECIEADPSLCRVDDLARQLHVSKRTLQRIFANYVGLGIKETIRRYRLQEAAEAAMDNPGTSWSAMAARLGYYDQSHLIAEFRATFGCSPSRLSQVGKLERPPSAPRMDRTEKGSDPFGSS